MIAEQVAEVARLAQAAGLNETTMSVLRARFRGMHLSYCNDDDVYASKPFVQSPGLNVYLVDGRQHCLKLTEDLESATGLLLAEVSDEGA